VDWGAIAIAVIGAVGLDRLIVFGLAWRANRRKINAEAGKLEAEAESIHGEAWEKAFCNLERVLTQQIKFQEIRINELSEKQVRFELLLEAAYRRIQYLMTGIKVLIGQLEAARIPPQWLPDEWKADEE
jgi:hypothetical protein